MESTGADEPQARHDWHGTPFSCEGCPHRDRHALGLCDEGRACVTDHRAALVQAFFARNPDLSDDYLDHPWFVVRVQAARRATVFRLPALISDPDPDVRWAVTQRLPRTQVLRLRDDPDPRVRIGVAGRLQDGDLVPLVEDPDPSVRATVARRINPSMLVLMLHDPDPEVRRVVARRIGADWLPTMIWDESPEVRLDVAARLDPEQLAPLARDPDVRVRHTVAERIDAAHLSLLAHDPDDVVREMVQARAPEIPGGPMPLSAARAASCAPLFPHLLTPVEGRPRPSSLPVSPTPPPLHPE
ncbi:4Fe4S-binding leucine-rich repeat protein [Pararhodospirillum oryzae]|uniref:LRV FeS4 cluster domain-containing protein n=1 Tax=Pararhodospirillum oryzae TaxID=478448 RepID=A0A512H8J2_9PROT|nr:4Fe4S-binding leucine-rich repeat protein [Pararhodospirillum oryzae]GEO81773.1 hypothetical protein ROR02_19040 [Pararhodospirillum oryzae]